MQASSNVTPFKALKVELGRESYHRVVGLVRLKVCNMAHVMVSGWGTALLWDRHGRVVWPMWTAEGLDNNSVSHA